MNDILKKTAVIIPIHKLSSENDNNLILRAIGSVKDGIDIIVSYPNKEESIKEFLKNLNRKLTFIGCDDGSDMCTLVNHAVANMDKSYEWFSILEYDDEYTKIAFDQFAYHAEYMPEIGIFVPLVELYLYNAVFANSTFFQYGNEAIWANGFSEETGYFDAYCVENYFNFIMSGGFFKRSDWDYIGGLKKSIKVVFWYEFLLRACKMDVKAYVIPKAGYKHYVNRIGSMSVMFSDMVSDDEVEFWINTSKTESSNKEEHEIEYTNSEE